VPSYLRDDAVADGLAIRLSAEVERAPQTEPRVVERFEDGLIPIKAVQRELERHIDHAIQAFDHGRFAPPVRERVDQAALHTRLFEVNDPGIQRSVAGAHPGNRTRHAAVEYLEFGAQPCQEPGTLGFNPMAQPRVLPAREGIAYGRGGSEKASMRP
jgi:hypothetical protein